MLLCHHSVIASVMAYGSRGSYAQYRARPPYTCIFYPMWLHRTVFAGPQGRRWRIQAARSRSGGAQSMDKINGKFAR